MANEQISLPYLIVILALSGFLIRYLFFAPSRTGPGPAARQQSREAVLRRREEAVERIQQMFPQADRRALLWDLQRNGGNVQQTTERILTRGGLDTPPITFQPPPPPPPAAGPGSGQAPPSKQPERPAQPDLITRYRLQDKVSRLEAPEAPVGGKGKGWSSNRDERQSMLQRRRDEMILAARRKMEAKIAAEGAPGGG